MPRGTLDTETLQAALIGFQHRIAEIEARMVDIRKRLVGNRRPSPHTTSSGATGVRSAAARRRMSAAQKKRWAAVRQKSEKSVDVKAPGKVKPAKKRRISAAGRKRMIEATKRRWAKFRAKKAAAAKKKTPR